MTSEAQDAIWRLRTRWLGSYRIVLIDDTWKAIRYHQPTVVLTAGTPEQLEESMRADYATMSRSHADVPR